MNQVVTVIGALAMGLVVCLHLPTLPKHWVLDLGVPWFFFASGFWYGRSAKTYGEQIAKRVRTLLVPYFLCNIIWFPILFVANWIGWKYCGEPRVVDGSGPCVVRCLGLSPFAWPALVPTWFLRSLFVVIALVGFLEEVASSKYRVASRVGVCAALWAVYLTRGTWIPDGALWHGFFSFGLSLAGCAYFATGIMVASVWCLVVGERKNLNSTVHLFSPPTFLSIIRREMMPVYLLHVVVIITLGWVAKALHVFPYMATLTGDIAMWFVGIGGAIALGELLRRYLPRCANVLFGGR